MDFILKIQSDITAGVAPLASFDELYRDSIHMSIKQGRYLMHNAMRFALGQPKSDSGYEAMRPELKTYLDRILASGLPSQVSGATFE